MKRWICLVSLALASVSFAAPPPERYISIMVPDSYMADNTKRRTLGRVASKFYLRFQGGGNVGATNGVVVLDKFSSDFRPIANTNRTAWVAHYMLVRWDRGKSFAWYGPDSEAQPSAIQRIRDALGPQARVRLTTKDQWQRFYNDSGVERKPARRP